MKPGTPILALTATATPDVVNDIQEKLHFEKKNVFKMSFERKNLAYIVRTVGDKDYEMIHILRCVGGAAIVYCRSRKHTKEIAALLNKNGIKSTFYHAGLLPTVKDERQRAWQNDEIRVIVATNAFGMGIDKPDVRMVIHIDCPDSLEAYFQEAGRAGRDGNKAYAVLLYDPSDERKLKKRIDDTFPPKDFIRNVYEHLAYFFQVGIASGRGKTFEFNIDKFSYIYKFFPIRVDAALRILERCGYIHYEDNPDGKARLMFCLNRNELYLLDNLSPKEDAIVTALLRTYGGLFTDYVYIDESLIAYQADTSIEQVYVTLKNFSARHIVQFIPRRKTPYITYAKDRIDGEKVIIPNEVWEQRREQYAHRIEGILRYAKEDYICRSRQLLAYFGEATQEDCHQCDVCLEQYTDNTTKDKYFKEAQQAIRLLLGDHKPHFITELRDILLPSQYVDEALEFLVGENQIHIDGSYISLYE